MKEEITEELLWKLIKDAKWKTDHNYNRIRDMWKEELSNELREELSKFIHRKHSQLMNKFEKDWLADPGIGVSDDGWSDLTADVLGRGKKFYDTVTVKKLQKMANEYDYRESFIYSTQF